LTVSRTRRALDLLEEELEDVEMSAEEVATAVANLPMTVEDWAAMIREKVAVALKIKSIA
jgi:hypothetical protein